MRRCVLVRDALDDSKSRSGDKVPENRQLQLVLSYANRCPYRSKERKEERKVNNPVPPLCHGNRRNEKQFLKRWARLLPYGVEDSNCWNADQQSHILVHPAQPPAGEPPLAAMALRTRIMNGFLVQMVDSMVFC